MASETRVGEPLETIDGRLWLNKVPEVTLFFWVIKILCTTVGETAADFLNVSLNLGLTGTSVVTGVLLAVALVVQFRSRRYVAARYWVAVALISVFGTLVTDNLTDALHVALEVSTVLFAILLALSFIVWYSTDRTLSIHSIRSPRREAFYWLAVLFSFALGTAAGDLMAEALGLGYLVAGTIVAGLIAATFLLWRGGMNSVLSFWLVYIFTRPLGASIGDFLSQPRDAGGLGLGTTGTSVIFLGAILVTVAFLTITKLDVAQGNAAERDLELPRGGLAQTAVVVAVLVIGGGAGYSMRKNSLASEDVADIAPITITANNAAAGGAPASQAAGTPTAATAAAGPASPLGDLSKFRTITQDTLNILTSGDQAGATRRIGDLEREWDNAEARLKPRDSNNWTMIDGKIDTVLRRLRSTSPNIDQEKQALNDLLSVLG